MEKYIPDIYQKNIFSINYDNLLSRGIKNLLFDLDNTIAPIYEKRCRNEVKELFKFLKNKNMNIYIVSNSIDARVSAFSRELKVDYLSSAKKPSFKKIEKLISDNMLKLDQTALIGDSMMDDVVCGNGIGITTILIDQISKREFPFARIKRIKGSKKIKR